MITYKSEKALIKNLNKLKLNCLSKTVILHSDILNLGFYKKALTYEENLKFIHDLILEVFHDFEIIVPTFNYDFLNSKIYDLKKDKAQVGALNEYFRKKYINTRTYTPVFNIVSTNARPSIKKTLSTDPHGEKSFYKTAYSKSYDIIFIGKFIPSMAHFVERKISVPYRYYKKFTGKIRYLDGKEKPIKIKYNVRPPFSNLIKNDLNKIIMDLKRNKILFSIKKKNSFIGCYNSKFVVDFWLEKNRLNNLYFLTQSSQKKVRNLFKKFGYPLNYKRVERSDI